MEDRREHWLRATLAHELGHHMTATMEWIWLASRLPLVYRKADPLAQRWALEYLMPAGEFVRAAAAGLRADEMAEWFGVPESWVAQRADWLRRTV